MDYWLVYMGISLMLAWVLFHLVGAAGVERKEAEREQRRYELRRTVREAGHDPDAYLP